MTTPFQPGPCSWPFATACAAGWSGYNAGVQAFAESMAKFVLWALSGRQFGVCDLVLRPCQWSKCGGRGLPPSGWWSAGSWIPHVVNGVWVNSCACDIGTFCSCRLDCSVNLPGPVAAITEVTVDGIIVPPEAYVVYDGAELKRVDGDCWPVCQDWNAAPTDVGSFVVSYQRGVLPPDGTDCVTGMLAVEFAKACIGEKCRLPRMLQSISRQGVSVQYLTPQQLTDLKLTGIPEVDLWVTAVNPDRLDSDSVVWSPEVRRGRQRTS